MSVLKTYAGETYGQKPSMTYRIVGDKIVGMTDGVEAVKQSARLLLNVDRFIHPIYSWDYGNELKGCIGKSRDFIRGDLKRRITETLLEDDRIESINYFVFLFERECVQVSFTVYSVFGEFNLEKEVNIIEQ